jgi:hypothetical protein
MSIRIFDQADLISYVNDSSPRSKNVSFFRYLYASQDFLD